MFLVDAPTAFNPERSNAELFPRVFSVRNPSPQGMVGRGGFEPPKAFASRFTVCPLWPLGYLPAGYSDCNPLICLALAGGFEPPTHCLQGSCSTPELRQQSQTLTLGSESSKVKTISLVSRVSGAPLRSRKWPPPRTR